MSPRHDLDFYETPPHYVEALTNVIGQPRGKILEPCVGEGHIVKGLTDCNRVVTNDIDPKRPAKHHDDAADPSADVWGVLGYDWCITNPPFNREQEILQSALRWCKRVAFLARLSFLEPTIDRRHFWRRHAAGCEIIVLPRYSFRNDDTGKRATDSMTCCWLVWRHLNPSPSGVHVDIRRPPT